MSRLDLWRVTLEQMSSGVVLMTEPASCVDKAQGVMLGTITYTVPRGDLRGVFQGVT